MKYNLTATVSVLAAMLAFTPPTYAQDWNQYDCGPGWGPISSKAPTYPVRAQKRGIEGYVVMSFTILTDGTIEE